MELGERWEQGAHHVCPAHVCPARPAHWARHQRCSGLARSPEEFFSLREKLGLLEEEISRVMMALSLVLWGGPC